jgi:hypothetical protein
MFMATVMMSEQEQILEQAIFAPEPDESPVEARGTFEIDTQKKATWAARKILNAEERISERQSLAREYKSRIDNWLKAANEPDTCSIESLKVLLEPYLSEELKGQRKRSIDLVGVRIGYRKLPERIEIVDEQKALQFCEQNQPDVVITRKELSKAGLKACAKAGTLIPGVVIDGGTERIYAKAQ